MKLNKQILGIGALCWSMAGMSVPAAAIVYTSSNEVDGNRVIAFDADKRSGQLVEIGSFDTRGKGTGAPMRSNTPAETDQTRAVQIPLARLREEALEKS